MAEDRTAAQDRPVPGTGSAARMGDEAWDDRSPVAVTSRRHMREPAPRWVVWGRMAKRSGKKSDLRWMDSSFHKTAASAYAAAKRLVHEPGAWNYTAVLPEGERPRARQHEDFFRWTITERERGEA